VLESGNKFKWNWKGRYGLKESSQIPLKKKTPCRKAMGKEEEVHIVITLCQAGLSFQEKSKKDGAGPYEKFSA